MCYVKKVEDQVWYDLQKKTWFLVLHRVATSSLSSLSSSCLNYYFRDMNFFQLSRVLWSGSLVKFSSSLYVSRLMILTSISLKPYMCLAFLKSTCPSTALPLVNLSWVKPCLWSTCLGKAYNRRVFPPSCNGSDVIISCPLHLQVNLAAQLVQIL